MKILPCCLFAGLIFFSTNAISQMNGNIVEKWEKQNPSNLKPKGGIMELPYFQGFENSGDFPPTGWTISGNKSWERGVEAFEGAYCAKVNYFPAGTAILTTPYFNIPSGCKIGFYWKDDDIVSKNSVGKVVGHDTTFFEISTDHGQTWTVLSHLSNSEVMLDYLKYSHYLGNIAGDSILFRWRDWSDGSFSAWGIGIDNIQIIPACLQCPYGLLNMDSFDFGDVEVGYTVNFTNNFSLYNDGYGELNIDSVYGLENSAFSMNVNLIGQIIPESQQINFGFNYLPVNEGPDSAICYIQTNGNTLSIKLYGNGIVLQPFHFEGFENINSIPSLGWKTIDADGDGHNWHLYSAFPHNGVNCAASASFLSSGEILDPDNYLILPKINVDESNCILSWWVAAGDSIYCSDHYGVFISTTNNSISDFQTLLFEETLVSDVWARRVVDLRNYSGEKVFIAFRHYQSTDNLSVKLDDIALNPFFENVVKFHITSNGEPVNGALVTFNGITNTAGDYFFTNNVPGNYLYTISKSGYVSQSGMASIDTSGAVIDVDLAMVTYTVTFIVKLGEIPYPGASITFNSITNEPGNYMFTNVLPGTYSYSVFIPGFSVYSGAVTVENSDIFVEVIGPGYYSVTFRPINNGVLIENAVITLDTVTNAAGNYVFDSIFEGVYPYLIQKTGFESRTGNISVLSEDQIVDVEMVPVFYNVFLNANLSGLSGFNPSTDQVFVSGSFNNWVSPGTDSVYCLTKADSNLVYTKLLHLSTGLYSYKYYINPGTDGGENGQHECHIFSDTILNDMFITNMVPIEKSQVEIYPNPFETVLFIKPSGNISNVAIIDWTGKEVVNIKNTFGFPIQIQTTDFLPGLYLIKYINFNGLENIVKAIKY